VTAPDQPAASDSVDPASVIDITVKRDTGIELTFADGMVAQFELVDVRTKCPCATCRSLREKGEVAWPRPGIDAFRRWADGDQPFGPDSGLPGAFNQ